MWKEGAAGAVVLTKTVTQNGSDNDTDNSDNACDGGVDNVLHYAAEAITMLTSCPRTGCIFLKH